LLQASIKLYFTHSSLDSPVFRLNECQKLSPDPQFQAEFIWTSGVRAQGGLAVLKTAVPTSGAGIPGTLLSHMTLFEAWCGAFIVNEIFEIVW